MGRVIIQALFLLFLGGAEEKPYQIPSGEQVLRSGFEQKNARIRV
jgi:hypothetical protein